MLDFPYPEIAFLKPSVVYLSMSVGEYFIPFFIAVIDAVHYFSESKKYKCMVCNGMKV